MSPPLPEVLSERGVNAMPFCVSGDHLGPGGSAGAWGARSPAAGHRPCLTEHLIRVAPLVVVPTQNLHQIAVDDLGELEIDDRCARIADDVRRHERVTRYSEHSGIALAAGLFREDPIHLVDAGLLRG